MVSSPQDEHCASNLEKNKREILIDIASWRLEQLVCLVTTLLIAYRHRTPQSSWLLIVHAMALITEEYRTQKHRHARQALSSGIAMGCMVLPWILARHPDGALMSSCAIIVYMMWDSTLGVLSSSMCFIYMLLVTQHGIYHSLLLSVGSVGCFHGILHYAPNTFTLGEATAIGSGMAHIVLEMFHIQTYSSPIALCVVSIVGMTIVLFVASLIMEHPVLRVSIGIIICCLCAVFYQEILYSASRRSIILYWCIVMALSLPIMQWASHNNTLPNIIVRKGFHIIAILLFVPSLIWDAGLLAMGLSVALSAFMVLEILRMSNIPHVSVHIHSFMSSFIDSRDQGAFYVTHMTLLLGLAIPIWLSQPWSTDHHLSMASYAGLLATGVGDASASIIGTLYGTIRVSPTSKKTLQGTVASIVSILLCWMCLVVSGCCVAVGKGDMAWIVMATILSSFFEAVTDQFDNLFVSLQYFALIQCLDAGFDDPAE